MLYTLCLILIVSDIQGSGCESLHLDYRQVREVK